MIGDIAFHRSHEEGVSTIRARVTLLSFTCKGCMATIKIGSCSLPRNAIMCVARDMGRACTSIAVCFLLLEIREWEALITKRQNGLAASGWR